MRYDTICKTCKAKREIVKPMADDFPPCPQCAGELRRTFAPVPVHYHAPGFFSSDVGRLRGEIGPERYAQFEHKRDDIERRTKNGRLTAKEKFYNAQA